MWYTLGYANTFICTPAHGGRAGNPGDRSPVLVRLYRTPLPDPPRQCRGPVDDHDCARPALHRSDRAQRHSCLPPARSRRAAAAIVTTAHHVDDLRRWDLRGPAGAVAPESADVRQAHQPVDARAGRRGQFRPGAHPAPGQRRSHSCGPPPLAGVLEAGQTLDHQSRSGVCPKKKTARPADPAGHGPADVGAGLWRRSLVESAGPAQPTWLDRRRGHAQVAGADARRRTIPIPRRWPVMACWCGRGRSRPTRCGSGLSQGAP